MIINAPPEHDVSAIPRRQWAERVREKNVQSSGA